MKCYRKCLEQLHINAVLLYIVVALLSVMSVTYFHSSRALAIQRDTVKVGFFAHDGYHIQDDKCMRSGYGYDFLKMAEDYNNWKYEYVGYEQGWTDMLDMLDDGEIDLVTFAQKTPAREKKYDFSDSPIGTGSIILTVKESNKKYMVGDTASYDGMKVGILKNSTHGSLFKKFAKEKGFKYTEVLYDTSEHMEKDFQAGNNIDAMLNSSLRTLNDETILEELNPVDFYVIVKKGNTKLLKEINYAIAQMDMNIPGWRLTLKNKYYSDNYEESISFNKTETDYINALKRSGKMFKVVTNPDLAPYSYYKDGKAAGIVPEIFEEICKRTGIKYEYIQTDTYKEYNKLVRDGGADIDLTCFADYGLAEYHNVNISNSYLSTTLALVTKGSYSGDVNTIAEVDGAENNTTYTAEIFDTVKSKKYATHAQCVQAVLDDKVDGTYMYTYAAQQAVENDVKNRLVYTIMPEYSVDMCIGLKDTLDYRLMSVIDEGVKSVKGTFAQKVIQNQIAGISHSDSIVSMVYDYPEIALLIVGFALIIVFMICLFTIRMLNDRKQRAQADELSRFMGYVCESNELVMEMDAETECGQCSVHNMENGVLVSREFTYKTGFATNLKKNIHPDDYERVKTELGLGNLYNTLISKGNGAYIEARAKGADGDYRWYSFTVRAMPKTSKHPNNIIMFKKNIDNAKKHEEEQKRVLEDALENARNASSAKGLFLSKMSHEIRTPLNAVIGYMDIAKDSGDNPEKIMHCVENSDMAAKHLLNIINDVLDMSSIESGKMKIAHEEFDLKKQITTVSTIFYNQAKSKGVQFEVRINDVTDEWVIGDSLRVNQVLMNLLSNAVKFTPEEGLITLTVSQMSKDEQKVYMNIKVSDTGIGMSEAYKKKLFTPFEQESATTAQKYGGTGLGLSITHNLINMMGGSIEVDSEEGVGSTFTVSLHFGISQEHHSTDTLPQDYSNVRALIVDDDNDACIYMKEMLKRCKVKCDVVYDSQSAIRQIKRRKGTDYAYDMCIMDWNLPDQDGVSTAHRIKEQYDQDMPIVIATAYDITEIEDQAEAAGVDKVVSKPLFQSTMFNLLVSLYGKYHPEQKEVSKHADLSGMHVILVEDNVMNMEIAVDILTKAGIIVDQAIDGREAADMFIDSAPGTYEVILMDIQMPVMNGYEATDVIRKSGHPQAKSIPIIALTANAFAEDVTAALAAGMDDHISKPINYDKLFNVLNKMKQR